MARNKFNQTNIDKTDLGNYPDGRIKNNDGTGNGTPVDEQVYGDIHENIAFLMRRYGISFNGMPDNVTNGYQFAEAIKALPSKNDFRYTLSKTNSDTINIPIKIGKLDNYEIFHCVSGINSSGINKIKGKDNVILNLSIPKPFKAGDPVVILYTHSGVKAITDINSENIQSYLDASGFLKAATTAQELAGTSNVVSTTPKSNKAAFDNRLIGNGSSTYLASTTRNGLLSKELFHKIINLTNPVYVRGVIRGVNPGVSSGNLSVGGNISSATAVSGNGTQITVRVSDTPADGMKYMVRMTVQSKGDAGLDNDLFVPSFRKINQTTFVINIDKSGGVTQNIDIHVEVLNVTYNS